MSESAMEIIEEVIGVVDLDEFHVNLLRVLKRVVPSDVASLNDLGPGPHDVGVVVIPEPPPGVFENYVEHRDQNPIAAYQVRTRDGRATRFSDHVTREELEALPLYQTVYRPWGLHHQIAFTLVAGPSRVLAIALSRGDPDYTDDERDLLNRVRPLLISAFRGAVEHSRLRRALAEHGDDVEFVAALREHGLTRREAEVMRLVALGRSNDRVATELAVSGRTVAKHLERAFRKLDVHSRSEAAVRAWELVSTSGADRRATGMRTSS